MSRLVTGIVADNRYDYPSEEGITIQYDSQPAEGKRLPIRNVSLGTCDPCRMTRWALTHVPC